MLEQLTILTCVTSASRMAGGVREKPDYHFDWHSGLGAR